MLEFKDNHTRFTGLEEQLKRIGFKGVAAVPKITGKGFRPSRCDVLLVGSFALNNPIIRAWFRDEAASLRSFVAQGGVVLVFAQEADRWDIEPWLPEKAFLLRGRGSYGELGFVEASHPIFSMPNPISRDRLKKEWRGDGKWPGHTLSWWTFRKSRCSQVLAGQDERREEAWCVEMGWGDGRVVFFACTPDKIPGNQPEVTQKLCDDLLQNALTYAQSVINGKAHPLPEDVLIKDEEIDTPLYARRLSREEEIEFDRKVNETVDKGVGWLRKMQKEDGSWGSYKMIDRLYEAALTSLSLLSMLNSGVSKHDPAVGKGFEFLYDHPPKYTYEIGFTLMAMDAKAAPMYERFELAGMPLEKREKHEWSRELSGDERLYMEDLTELILSHHGKGGSWRYDLETSAMDISNGQFGILGLKAASRCGIKVPQGIWEKVLKYYLTYQSPNGPRVKLLEFKNFKENGLPEFYVTPAKARGWGYNHGFPPEPSGLRGSRANIGISCLVLCYEELVKLRSPVPVASKNRAELGEAIRDSLAWLTDYWAIETNPNGEKHYYYYYIYSLERVGSLLNRRFIGSHDWYREGAAYLMDKQQPDGSWSTQANEWGSNISNTSFALLFLKRSTPPPVVTIGR